MAAGNFVSLQSSWPQAVARQPKGFPGVGLEGAEIGRRHNRSQELSFRFPSDNCCSIARSGPHPWTPVQEAGRGLLHHTGKAKSTSEEKNGSAAARLEVPLLNIRPALIPQWGYV